MLLVKGADFFVDGSSSVAKILRIPSVIVGVTVVSLGTSLPELAVSTTAALKGANEIALSNVIGSNMFNFMVVLGVTAIIYKKGVPVKESLLKVEFPLNLIVTFALIIMSMDIFIRSGFAKIVKVFKPSNKEVLTGTISRIDGIILLIVFIAFMIYTVRAAIKARNEASDQEDDGKKKSVAVALTLIVVGIVMIKFGGDFVVNAAQKIATAFGMSQTLIGLTIVACGTSLPELVTSVVAAKKGECDLAVGNAIGSNLFNMLFILGVSTSIHAVDVFAASVVDLCVLLFMCIVGTIFCKRKNSINAGEGVVMTGIYILYIVYAIIR